jgi:Dolichyl-phosphate-mannose-protein mannosyltransferase
VKRLVTFILGAICLGNILWIMRLNSLYYLPSGIDSMHWLAYAKAIVSGIRFPLWSTGLLQVPPIPLIILGFFIKVFGDILGTQLFGAVILGILPLSFFILINRMFGPRVGIVASLFIAITPVFYEMWGSGMYPNLFGFSVLFFALFAILNFIERKNLKWGVAAFFMIVLVMFSHNLTSIVFVATLLLWAVLSLLTRQRIRELVILSLFSLVVFVLYRVFVPSQYVLSNANAAFVLAMDYSKFIWVFKYIPLFLITVLCAAYGCYLIYKNKPVHSLMVISLVVTSFVLTFGLPLVGINLDQARFLIFCIPGFIIGIAYLIHEVAFKIQDSEAIFTKVNIKSLVIIMAVAVIIAVNGYIGIGTSWYANKFYRWSAVGAVTPWGDADIQLLVNWIKTYSGDKDIFVSENYLSKTIMGLSERRTLEGTDLAYLFMQGESERAIAADSLLHSNYEVYHPSFRIRDQYPVQNHNPVIALWWEGKYYDTIYFDDNFWQATVEKGGSVYDVSPDDTGTAATAGLMSVIYETPDVVFRRDVKIEDGGIKVIFSAEPRQQDVMLLSMTVDGWRPLDNNNLTDILFDGTTLTLVDGQVDARIMITDYAQVDYYLADPVYQQSGFWAAFEAEGDHVIAELFIPCENISQDAPLISNAAEIIQKYGVSYFAVLNNAKDEIWFLETNGYRKVYENTLVSVYSGK